MTALTYSWTAIADTAVDPDSPLDSVLMTGIAHDLIHLREWVGAGFFAGAVQDHNHDGANSALIEIGPNYQRNGSFETNLSGWTITTYTGGTVALNTANDLDGASSIGFTSTSTANGGGDALSAAFFTVTGGRSYAVSAIQRASVADISSKIEILWYDDAQSQIGSSVLLTTTVTPTIATLRSYQIQAPSTARFAKVRVMGGVPGAGSATGTIYFDGVVVSQIAPGALLRLTKFTASGTWTKQNDISFVVAEVQGAGSGAGTVGGTSSFGSHCSATGGHANSGAGGVGSGGDINLRGGPGPGGVSGMSARFGGGSLTSVAAEANSGAGFDDGTDKGAAGGYALKRINADILGATETVTIGAKGTGSAADGIVLVWEYA